MTRLPGVRAHRSSRSSRSGQVVLVSYGATLAQPASWSPSQEVLQAIPDLHLARPRMPQLPRIPAGSTDQQVVRLLADGWDLAYHALTGDRRHSQPSRWAPGTLTTLTASGRLLASCGLSPAAYAATRWRSILAWSKVPPKGPTAVYGARWIAGSAEQVRAYQLTLQSRLVPLGPAGIQLASLRSGLAQAMRDHRPSTAQEAAAILAGLAPDWRVQLERARSELAADLAALQARMERREWVWG